MISQGWLPWQNLRRQIHPLASRLTDRGYRLRSQREVDLAAELGFSLDVNQATVDDWLRLPGISIRQAQVLSNLRQSGVAFYSLEDMAAALQLPYSQLQPLAKVLRFCYYDHALEGAAPGRVSLNQASVTTLGQVPGLNPSLAQAIVWDRLRRGPFRDLADFQRRLQVPGEVLAGLMHYLYC